MPLPATAEPTGRTPCALDAEAARGTDPASVHRALWSLLAGHRCLPRAGCIDRTDPLGRTASRVLRDHRRAGDTVVVVSDLIGEFGPLLAEHLQVQRVVCGAPDVDCDDRWAGGFAGILLGAAAARAAEREAHAESVDPAHCIAYGRYPRDRDLLGAVGHAVYIDYGGDLHPQSPTLAGLPVLTDDVDGNRGFPVSRRNAGEERARASCRVPVGALPCAAGVLDLTQ